MTIPELVAMAQGDAEIAMILSDGSLAKRSLVRDAAMTRRWSPFVRRAVASGWARKRADTTPRIPATSDRLECGAGDR